MRFSYPCEVSRDSETGQVIVECKNPSAFAFGDSLEEAVKEMHSLLLDCVSDYFDEGKIFPNITKPAKKNEVSVELTPSETVKVLFLNSVVETKTKPIQIARRLGIAKQEVTRILNPRQKTKIDTLEKAIEATGKKINLFNCLTDIENEFELNSRLQMVNIRTGIFLVFCIFLPHQIFVLVN